MNGGGAGGYYSGSYGAGGGGGASDIRTTSGVLSSRLVIAGGGGGAGLDCTGYCLGGDGGGTTAQNGENCSNYTYGSGNGQGGSTTGGLGGSGGGANGVLGVGGAGYTSNPSGGGGAGYYGGGGSGNWVGGGGGSSYTDPVLATAVAHTPGFNSTGDGSVIIFNPCSAGLITGNASICPSAKTQLTDATAGGNWTSATSSIATVSSTGLVTGVAPGTATISYGGTFGCGVAYAIQVVTVNPVPAAILGNAAVCVNNFVVLSDTTSGGLWSISNTAQATIGAGTGLMTGVTGPTNPTITYTATTGCFITATASVNPLPASIGFPFGSSSANTVCVGSSVTLTSVIGGTWTSSNPGLATINSGSGLLTGVIAGVPIITYKLTATGCFNTTSVTVNSVPAPISGFNSLCFGTSTPLNDITPGGVWSSSSPGVATVGSTGIVTAANPLGGTTTISYKLTATGCAASQLETVNTLPTAYNLFPTGVNNYCPGTTAPDVYLAASAVGVNYQLYRNSVPTPPSSPLAGTGSLLDYGPQTTAGTYTVKGTNTATGCVNTMNGSAVVGINPVPPVDSLRATNGGSYCFGTSGTDLTVTNDSTGLVYTLNQAGVGAVGIAFGSTGTPADFGDYTVPGVYTATVQNSYGCIANMLGSINVTENLLPLVYNVTVSNGGSYCAGGSGVHVGLDNSNSGINYQLWRDGTTLVTTMPGSNSGLDFGLQTIMGNYTVTAINATTGCSNSMNGTAVVNINPLPNPYTVSDLGSSSYCKGGTGVTIQIGGSDLGINYQLFMGPTPIGSAVAGTGSGFNFPPDTLVGSYAVVAIDQSTGCTSNMPGTGSVAIYPALGIHTLSGAAGSYCAGGAGVDFKLDNSEAGISYVLYNNGGTEVDSLNSTGGALDFGLQTIAGTYTAVAIDPSSTCTANMNGNPSLIVNSLPAAYTVTIFNGGDYCTGEAGVSIGLSFSDVGVNYQLWRSGTPLVTIGGSSAAINFGTFGSGTYNVVATNGINSCSSNMSNTVTATMHALPTIYSMTGGGSFCVGGAGKPVGLNGSDTGVTYQLWNGVIFDSSVSGTGAPLNFGSQTSAGAYTIVATNNITGCISKMSGSSVITTNPVPSAFSVTGGGDFCAGGAGKDVALSGSTPGISYQLMNGPMTAGPAVNGSGSGLDFGLKNTGGTYTVVAVNVTSGCTANMLGGAIVTVDSLPVPYKVLGGGAYCQGSGGADVSLLNSEPGINYVLYNGGKQIGAAVPGTGIALDLGLQKVTGTYTVVGVDAATGCASNMTGSSAPVTINPTPAIYTITGGGHFCAGGAGFPIYLSGSNKGINYQLYNGTALAGKTLAGTGAALNFGAQANAGTYTAVATDATTGCMSNMSSGGTIVIDPVPDAFAISGGGHYCTGGTGVSVDLDGSVAGINYQLMNGTTPVGLPVGGTGASISFGLEKGSGIYTVHATNPATGCASDMTGSTTVTADPVVTPAVSITTSTGDNMACIGMPTTFTANSVYGGSAPSYQWSVNGIPTVNGSSYNYIASDKDVVQVTLTSDMACVTSNTATKLMTMSVLPYQTPSANTTVSPGNSVCKGTTVTFTATTESGGSSPAHMWLKNSVPVGSGDSYSYIPDATGNGDVVVYELMSDYRCRTAHTDTVFSNPIVMAVDAGLTPVFSITSHLGPIIGVGRVDTFDAVVKGTGSLYNYQWMINNMPVSGANSATYIDYNVFNSDVISCEVTRVGSCGNQSTTESTKVVNLMNEGVKNISGTGVDINVSPNPNKGEFTVKGTLGTNDDAEVTLEVTNMLGQVVYNGKVTARNGNIDEHILLGKTMPNGMYLLNLRSGVANSVFHIVVEQ